MNSAKSRPALGQLAQIGTLYDATTDSFLGSIFRSPQLPEDLVVTNVAASAPTVQTTTSDSYKDKFDLLGVSPDLGASIIGGLLNDATGQVPAQSSLSYLSRQRNTNAIAQGSLVHRLLTVREKLKNKSPSLASNVDIHALHGTRATHVVVVVEWGLETVVHVNQRLGDGQPDEITPALEVLKNSLATNNDIGHPEPSRSESLAAQLEFDIFSNVLSHAGHAKSIEEAQGLLCRQLPQMGMQANMGKGCPVNYKVLPIAIFMHFIGDDDEDDDEGDQAEALPGGAPFTQIGSEHLDTCRAMFEDMGSIYCRLMDYVQFLTANRDYVSPDHRHDIQRRAEDLEQTIARAKTAYGQSLRDIRTGSRPPSVLQELRQSLSTIPKFDVADEQRGKVEFIAAAVKSGAVYLGYYSNGRVDDLIRAQQQSSPPIYVLSLSDSALKHESWPANKALFIDLLQTECKAGATVAVEDHDADGQPLEAPYIAEYQDCIQVTDNLLARRQYLADKCFARCNDTQLETQNVQKPVRRRFIKIPCPGPRCQGTSDLSWLCPRCEHALEYGYSDQYIYCDCGRGHFSNYTFKCSNASSHGPNYVAFRDETRLRNLLQSLASSDYVNILILGETGVGKSTFINAFVNYLSFATLDDAMESEKLEWVIPCSFQTQVMDRSRPDGRIIQHRVNVGDRDDEHDGSKGDSATQQTAVYPITIGSKTVRLIDTPGIGDTRGVQFDKKNMADILATLNSYEELHGILILLKSNSARLTITFEFCVKELLTHLHRSAVNNIAFGFTNTRISNYTPGDTFGPLQTLLEKQSDVHLSLTMQTSYCFDSESFRYLAAKKQGVFMDNEEDFRRSWKHSRDESNRLVDYFQTRPPHSVTNTISLNGTRQLVLELTKPLADISQLIRKNIAMFQDRERELADSRLTGDALRKKLLFERLELRKKDLSMPRTVCTNRDCIEQRDDGTGNRVVEFTTHCHAQCSLKDVAAEVVAFPGLISCWAFNGQDHCRVCTHNWREHLHILYEFEEYTATVTDTRIEQDLAANASDSEKRQHGLLKAQQLIREYEDEHKQVQSAAAQFGIYLKKNSITAYNDVTLDYLGMLIKQEKEKIEVGGGRERLDGLLEDRARHEELVAVLTARMAQPVGSADAYKVLDEAGVDAVVRKLYGLKHFGATLKTVQTTISQAHAATYRERPYRVGSNKFGRPLVRRHVSGPGHGHHGHGGVGSSLTGGLGGIEPPTHPAPWNFTAPAAMARQRPTSSAGRSVRSTAQSVFSSPLAPASAQPVSVTNVEPPHGYNAPTRRTSTIVESESSPGVLPQDPPPPYCAGSPNDGLAAENGGWVHVDNTPGSPGSRLW
ncbi:P-loop containing nucleoside triphosphate hydrolase [Naviculisporaceae sp. PSN 640]